MKSLEKIVWTEGLILSPQHFQQWDLMHEMKQQQQFTCLHPLRWGIVELIIDEAALLNGKFRIVRCYAIYPCSSFLKFDAENGSELSIDLSDEKQSPIEIFVCIPDNRKVSGISGYPDLNEWGRWQAEYREVGDEYQCDQKREVLFGRQKSFLLTNSQSRDHVLSLKIGEVRCNSQGQYQYIKEYIPPSLRIASSSVLVEFLQEFLERIQTTIQMFHGFQSHRANRLKPEYDDVVKMILLKILLTRWQTLNHLSQCLESTPMDLYRELLLLCTELNSITQKNDLMKASCYRHDQLRQIFQALKVDLQHQLQAIVPKNNIVLQLKKMSDTLYCVKNIPPEYLNQRVCFLAVKVASDNFLWVEHFLRQTKVSAYSVIDTLISSALPGVSLQHCIHPPRPLPIKMGYEYFYLQPQGDFWRQIKVEGHLAVFVAKEFSTAEFELITVEEEM
ncbi:MAG: type VI secretion system baseplate subunit TssK [Proteobacteria bacterium]|nr:type VI secretion system baseplate subunit TssK [Pseudomonadota bacterium]